MASTTAVSATTAAAAVLTCLLVLVSSAAALGVNVTEILERGGQYNTFVLHLSATNAGVQIENYLNISGNKLTIFAPTDNAFNKLAPGTINDLTAQHHVELMLFHIIANQKLTWDTFKTVSNPVMTMAGGGYDLNVTAGESHQVNLTTGVVTVPINNELNLTLPSLAVYSIETVLQPLKLFAPPPAATIPSAKSPPVTVNTYQPKNNKSTDKPAADPHLSGCRRGGGWWSAMLAGLLSLWALLLSV